MPLLEPKEVSVKTLAGDERSYVLSKFPAIPGREIVAGYPLTGIPKFGDYKSNEGIMLKLMCYVGVTLPNGTVQPLISEALVNNHVPDYETLMRIEFEMLRYNTSFFGQGEISTFLSDTAKKVIRSISPTLIPLSAQFLEAAKQRLKSLKTTTP
jgi:hypothetical protein